MATTDNRFKYEAAPELKARWFHAIDVPKRDTSPFKLSSSSNTNKSPSSWKHFTHHDSDRLEAAWQSLQRIKNRSEDSSIPPDFDARVLVNEDYLFEANIDKMEINPVYWHGPTYELRRGTWFSAGFGGQFIPCDENLARQIEDGYKKFQPWETHVDQYGTPTKSLSSNDSINEGKMDTKRVPVQEQRWALFGPYMNQYVAFEGPTSALLYPDLLSSKLGRAVMNFSATRMLRGWNEVEKQRKKNKAASKEKEKEKGKTSSNPEDVVAQKKADSKGQVSTDSDQKLGNIESLEDLITEMKPSEATAEQMQTKVEAEDYSSASADAGDRQINHLVLVIHGIGQKLGERVEAVNFVHDCNVLRRTIKESSRLYTAANAQMRASRKTEPSPIPSHGGVQVLPVQWRQKIEFGMTKTAAKESEKSEENEETTLADITLDGVPSIRQLVSDVILDVLLYMTPRYRQEMVKHVTEELNRIYKLFKERNPKFNGKVTILGHSLGSLLAFDILCHQGADDGGVTPVGSVPKTPEVDLSDLLPGAVNADDRRIKGLMERSAVRYGHLAFEVDRLFVLGSPVGLFLLLKGEKIQAAKSQASPGSLPAAIPAVNAIYNIFHPHDPVAYRIEPVILKNLSTLKPVPIPYTKGGLKGTIVGIQDLGSDIADRGRSMLEAARMGLVSTTAVVTSGLTTSVGKVVTMVSAMNAFKAPAGGSQEHIDETESEGHTKSNNISEYQPPDTHEVGLTVELQDISKPESKFTKSAMEKLNPRGRLDYVLQEGVLENPYLSALGVHMNYWSDPDCALFVLRELYGDTAAERLREGASTPSTRPDKPGGRGNGGSDYSSHKDSPSSDGSSSNQKTGPGSKTPSKGSHSGSHSKSDKPTENTDSDCSPTTTESEPAEETPRDGIDWRSFIPSPFPPAKPPSSSPDSAPPLDDGPSMSFQKLFLQIRAETGNGFYTLDLNTLLHLLVTMAAGVVITGIQLITAMMERFPIFTTSSN
ncbi:DDHD domain-containing protein [Phlyctochytrium arcticum]|nr:DDHD domain-containing protein [Phlyctochytrium arcticum]